MVDESNEFDVFLSHTKDDESAVEELASRLREESELNPYLRRWWLLPGDRIVLALERAIESSRTVAVFFGPGEPDAWRDQESELAFIKQNERRIIPVLLPGASEASIKGVLQTRMQVDLADEHGFERLVAGITGRSPELAIGFEPGPKLRRRLGAARKSKRVSSEAQARPTPYRVFLSSTLCEDEARRRELLEVIERAGMVASVAEPISSRAGARALEARRQELAQCDLFVMIVAWRYGRVPRGHERSSGELEYQWACERGLPRLVFLIEEDRPVVVTSDFDEANERWTKQSRLQALRERLVAEEPVIPFTTQNIGSQLNHRLLQWRSDGAAVGARARARVAARSKSKTRAKPGRSPNKPTTAKPKTQGRPATAAGPSRRPRARRASLAELSPYLESIERNNATTTMIGLSAPVSLHLDDLRVTVRAAFDRTDGDANPDAGPMDELELELHRAFESAEQAGRRVVVLTGPPASGKSTHLRRFALWLSRRGGGTLGLPADTIPMLLPLHESTVELEDPRETIAAQLRAQPELDASAVESLRAHERWLLLVDGIDEITDPQRRERALEWLARAIGELPQSRFLITRDSRPTTTGTGGSEPTLEVQLPPLDEAAARVLVERWFEAARPGEAEDPLAIKRRADSLWAELEAPDFRTTRMFELTRNPLVLALLCALHLQRGALPTRRVELYEQCFQILVGQWCGRSRVPRRFGSREARQVLQPLAHWLHTERGRTRASGRSIAAMLEPHLMATLGYDEIDGEAFLRATSTDHGILMNKGEGCYGLLHICFQEYLCARHLRSLSHGNTSVLDELAERFGEPWWREVTLLLVALGEPSLFVPLMQRVVERPSFVEHLDLVLECHHEAAEPTVEPFVELLRRPPARRPELWARQHAAAQVLEQVAPERWSSITSQLREHPFEPLRQLAGHDDRPRPSSRVSPRSGTTLVEIPAGRFPMGSHHREKGRKGSEGPRHEVELERFFIGKYLVTNEEYGHYLRARPDAPEPAYWGDPRYNHPRQPVVGVSWYEAMDYCAWAGLSLPTEAQWERACRGDTQTPYWSGAAERDLARAGWYADNAEQRLHPVGECEPNPFGLYDVHGNVWEWCLDEFGNYAGCPPRPGDGLRHPPLTDGNRVIRGGSWIDPARRARSAYRLNRSADNRLAYLGFRAIEPAEGDEPGED